MELTDIDFKNLRDYIQEIIGLSIQEDKKYLILQRLEPVVRGCNCKSFSEFYMKVKNRSDPELNDRIIAAITTNETSFFRDIHPFDTFREKILPMMCGWARERKSKLNTRRGAKVKVWCAAASTGQEPYSLAMIIMDALGNSKAPDVVPEDFSIIASDISSQVLSKAISGRYDQMDITRGVPENYRQRFFVNENNSWVIDDQIQKLVEFRRVNLSENFMFIGGFDVIFCRNVLIYFDLNMRKSLFDQFFQLLNREGILFLGASENTYGVTDKFESHHFGRTIFYKKKGD
jgi:chemotaxis protein methyltransferase CheR